ncbi:MAG TPA: class F sortase [Acidimicrobiales bacterium]|nr:class F sortase [Acidimicrobiales bacterium]
MARSAGKRGGPGPWGIAAGVLLVVAVGCIVVGLRDHPHPLPGPVAAPTTLSTAPQTPPVTVTPVVLRSVPVSLRVPALAMSVPLSTLGLNTDGTVQVPTNDVEPGWFRLGPTPGQVGSAVILGHVDSHQGPGVFFQLRTLQAGDQVQVSLADGAVVNFAVSSVMTYTKMQFPADQVYTSHGTSQLQLVTCGGAFDAQTGHYLSNIVVYTSFVSASPATTTSSAPVTTSAPLI